MSARSALDAVRPVIARLDASRGAESTKAELIEVWVAVESAIRELVGNTAASGQPLIRDARARQLLTFDQANALIAFLAVREQLDRPGDQPSDADVNIARAAFLKLDAGLMDGVAASTSPYAPQSSGSPAAAKAAPAQRPADPPVVPPVSGLASLPRKGRPVWPFVVAALVVVVVAVGAWAMFGRRSGSSMFADGIVAYQRGDRVTAASDFERATREAPGDAMPHVYLARMAREVGNFTIANQELQLALKADQSNLTARREYGAFFLSQGNYDQARVWYLHALEIDPGDVTSQGWLGCALIKLGRLDEGTRWSGRAGNGPWSACTTAARPMAPGTIRP